MFNEVTTAQLSAHIMGISLNASTFFQDINDGMERLGNNIPTIFETIGLALLATHQYTT
jgi:hypothetical protein